MKVKIIILTILFSITFLKYPFAAPSISDVSGTVQHGQSITIAGSAFGTKSTAAPLIWDDCSGTNILIKWSGFWPNSGTSAYQMAYRTPIRSVGLPHSLITKYMAGAHGDSGGYDAGYNVSVWKTHTGVSQPWYVYFSAYYRLDPAWVFGPDNNLKTFDFSNGNSPMTTNSPTDSNWYAEYNGQFPSASGSGSWHLNDDGSSLSSPDSNGHSWWWSAAVNPYTYGWIKQEYELKFSSTAGYVKIWENGVLKVDYAGPTDKYSGTTKTVALGAYARMSGQPNNYRYFSDLYYDTSVSRVLICNGSTYSNRGVCEVQIPSAWSASSITATVNRGAFGATATAYIYVLDSTGTPNSSGHSITFGDTQSEDTTAPICEITSPTSNATYSTSSATINLSGTASDAVGVTSVIWANDRGGSGTCTGTTSWSQNGISLYSGDNMITITAFDAANNPGTDTLTVTYTPPAVSSVGMSMPGGMRIDGMTMH